MPAPSPTSPGPLPEPIPERPPEPLPASMPITRLPPNPHCAAALPSSALLRGQKSVQIEHQGLIYRLQETKLGKLILTK
ncbi:hemin uptake protein HemP [Rhodoferax sp.]|uniref:hemin uptake protein HemP n=1 Tax=Rhodoferax sp. TaxID=50421 RepID=UPI0027620A65|nr:hemin uptake protein HemP [Rhodoferax sp.]